MFRRTAIILAVLLAPLSSWAGELKIVHLNIGQGDSTLILGPEDVDGNRVSVVVDAGDIAVGTKKDGGKIVTSVLKNNGVTKLDFFVATHYDADHIGGLASGTAAFGQSFVYGPNGVPGADGDDDGDGKANWTDETVEHAPVPDADELGKDDDIAVGQFIDRGEVGDLPDSKTIDKYLALVTAVQNRKSLTTGADVSGFEVDLGDDAKMICLSANGFVRGQTGAVENATSENERSLCFLITHKKFQYLLGGDTIGKPLPSGVGPEDAKVEQAIANYLASEDIDIDILHVNHHGADNASAADFLEVIKPEVAFISSGNGNDHNIRRWALCCD